MAECWHCGRPVPEWHGTSYVFGMVCRRAECEKIKAALSPRFMWFWFRACPPDPDGPGRPGSFNRDGEPQWPRGITESSLQTNIDSKRRARQRVGHA